MNHARGAPTASCDTPATSRTILVHLVGGDSLDHEYLEHAELVAHEILLAAGIRLVWYTTTRPRQFRTCGSPPREITVRLDTGSNDQLKHQVMGYAVQCASTGDVHILLRWFNTSVRAIQQAIVLGHVFAHEITHVLEGVSQHSAEGLMKAQWDASDFARMMHRPLRLTTEDIELIHRGAVNPYPESEACGQE